MSNIKTNERTLLSFSVLNKFIVFKSKRKKNKFLALHLIFFSFFFLCIIFSGMLIVNYMYFCSSVVRNQLITYSYKRVLRYLCCIKCVYSLQLFGSILWLKKKIESHKCFKNMMLHYDYWILIVLWITLKII